MQHGYLLNILSLLNKVVLRVYSIHVIQHVFILIRGKQISVTIRKTDTILNILYHWTIFPLLFSIDAVLQFIVLMTISNNRFMDTAPFNLILAQSGYYFAPMRYYIVEYIFIRSVTSNRWLFLRSWMPNVKTNYAFNPIRYKKRKYYSQHICVMPAILSTPYSCPT
jgi:hypothetical protein